MKSDNMQLLTDIRESLSDLNQVNEESVAAVLRAAKRKIQTILDVQRKITGMYWEKS